MIEIPLTRGLVAIVDDEDGDLLQFKWWAHGSRTIYACREIKRKTEYRLIKMHVVILERLIGRGLQPGEVPDHIDGNKLNNSRANLRLATRLDNCRNKKRAKNNTSGYKGVSLQKGRSKWVGGIYFNRKRIHLGYYDTPEEAHEAYKKAAKELFGEFARFE